MENRSKSSESLVESSTEEESFERKKWLEKPRSEKFYPLSKTSMQKIIPVPVRALCSATDRCRCHAIERKSLLIWLGWPGERHSTLLKPMAGKLSEPFTIKLMIGWGILAQRRSDRHRRGREQHRGSAFESRGGSISATQWHLPRVCP
jgi:hypothetical protein